jgi:hypothetical protein
LKGLALAGVYLDETEIQIMKKYLLLLLGGPILSFNLAFAQPVNLSGLSSPMPPAEKDSGDYIWVRTTNLLTKFDLDFTGGTPQDLVKAIEKATHKTLNVIIPEENADLKIPAVSVKNVTVVELFQVLEGNSAHDERFVWRDYSKSQNGDTVSVPSSWYDKRFGYGFKTAGEPSDGSIWYFYSDRPIVEIEGAQKECRFYQLGTYLDAGYKVEDITTAVETGWKMLGITNPPEISYHKDTRVLIAVGEADKVGLIGDILNQLPGKKSNDKDLLKSKDQ